MNFLSNFILNHQVGLTSFFTIISLLNGVIPSIIDFNYDLNNQTSYVDEIEAPDVEELAGQLSDSQENEKGEKETEDKETREVLEKSNSLDNTSPEEDYDDSWEEYDIYSPHESMHKSSAYKHDIGAIKTSQSIQEEENSEEINTDYYYGIGM